MTFDDRVKTIFIKADGGLPPGELDYEYIVTAGRRHLLFQRVAIAAAVGVAAIAVVGGVLLWRSGAPGPMPPTATPTSQESPTGDASASPSEEPDPRETVAPEACSAASSDIQLAEQPALPAPVAEMRRRIFEAAHACDYDSLEELGRGGDDGFTYSFGGGESAAEFWRNAEEAGDDPLLKMVQLLNLPSAEWEYEGADGRTHVYYAWPRAHVDPSDENYRELVGAGIYTERDVKMFKEFGAYNGYRLLITPDGDWSTFVAGD